MKGGEPPFFIFTFDINTCTLGVGINKKYMKDYKPKVSITLKKANTLTNKVLKMLDEDKYCIDIIQQNLAIIGLLKSANLAMLQGHFSCCIKNAVKANDEEKLDGMMDELLKVMKTAQNK